MSNSSLVTYTKLSPNHSGKRTRDICRITPHCVVGQFTAAGIAACFTSPARQASCNYGIGKDGGVALIVPEDCRSWCSSSAINDQRAVTIECASDTVHPYAFTNKVWNKLVELCVDICRRNGKTKLIWIADKNKALSYEPKSAEMILTVHRWFANKACPGDWLMSRMDQLARLVTAELGGSIVPYRITVATDRLVVRQKPRSTSKKVMYIYRGGVFTIVALSSNKKWGKLKSGAGWIALGYTRKV